MKAIAFTAIVLAGIAVFAAIFTHSTRQLWFFKLGNRDRAAFARLVAACGQNERLARKMIAHERLLDDRATVHQATMRALGTIENYRKRGILTLTGKSD